MGEPKWMVQHESAGQTTLLDDNLEPPNEGGYLCKESIFKQLVN